MDSAVEDAVEGGSTSTAGGLSGAQKGTALSKLTPKARTHHPYVVGLILIVVGGFALIGSITGTLPSMLAALFDPQALTDKDGKGVLGDIEGIATDITTFGLSGL